MQLIVNTLHSYLLREIGEPTLTLCPFHALCQTSCWTAGLIVTQASNASKAARRIEEHKQKTFLSTKRAATA